MALRDPLAPPDPVPAAAREWLETDCEGARGGGAGEGARGGGGTWPEGNCMLTDEYSPILRNRERKPTTRLRIAQSVPCPGAVPAHDHDQLNASPKTVESRLLSRRCRSWFCARQKAFHSVEDTQNDLPGR